MAANISGSKAPGIAAGAVGSAQRTENSAWCEFAAGRLTLLRERHSLRFLYTRFWVGTRGRFFAIITTALLRGCELLEPFENLLIRRLLG